MCSDAEIRQLISRITLNEKCSPSLDLLNNLDLIHRLIADRRKINFEYGKYDTDKKIKYYHKKRELIPVRVVFFNNRFYLKCYNEETEAWRTYRIDRMKDIEGGEVSKCHLPKEEKSDGFVIDMFEPEYFENVTLRVKRFLLDDMMEHFGEYASISRYSDDGNSVNISVRVGINKRFYLWVMKYGDGIELLSPSKVRSEFLSEVRKMLSAYPEFTP
jgi:predicted DNA-binding transcriptional regulator YafY